MVELHDLLNYGIEFRLRRRERAGQYEANIERGFASFISDLEHVVHFGCDPPAFDALDALSQSEGRRASNYVLMTMRLTDTENAEVVWEQPYEFRKDRVISVF